MEKSSDEKRFIFGVVKIGPKGQIVIPKEARETFKLNTGDSLVVLGDINQGIALMKASEFYAVYDKMKENK